MNFRSPFTSRHTPAIIYFILFALLALMAIFPVTAAAHGTDIQLNVVNRNVLEINALFDTGIPMSEAQVIIYAADDPQIAWHTGIADMDGHYKIEIDPAIQGQWAISIRTAGHGEILYFDVSRAGRVIVDQNAGRPAWLTYLLTTAVLASLGGVAWYFSKPAKKPNVASAT